MHKILVVDRFNLYREAICSFLAAEGDFDVFQASCSPATRKAIHGDGPFDLIIHRYNPTETSGLSLLHEIIALNSDKGRVALLADQISANHLDSALAAGVVGHIPATLPSAQLGHVIRLMIAGGIYAPAASGEPAPQEESQPDVSKRDLGILRALAVGATNKEIAAKIALQEVTVKVIIGRLLRHFGARNRAHLVSVVQSRNVI